MSSEVQEMNLDQSVEEKEESNAPARTTGLDVALVDGQYFRLAEGVEPPEGAEVFLYDDLESLELTKLGEIYGSLAGVAPKKYRSAKIAVESIAFQLKKKTPTNPWAPKVITKSTEPLAGGEKGEKKEKAKKEPTATTVTLLAPEDLADQLKKLAPQARDIVGIITDLVSKINTDTITGDVLSQALNEPSAVARLRTRQSPDRIFAYYRSALIASGIIRVV